MNEQDVMKKCKIEKGIKQKTTTKHSIVFLLFTAGLCMTVIHVYVDILKQNRTATKQKKNNKQNLIFDCVFAFLLLVHVCVYLYDNIYE
jgi:mannose/fructose/N-acetylgalactosamine-specific phosphotransferase system component IID